MHRKEIVTCAEMKELERRADAAGLSYYQMMENAGTAAFEIIKKDLLSPGQNICIFCGKGNNAGDGFVIARKLMEQGSRVMTVLTSGEPATPDAIANFALIRDKIPCLRLYENQPEQAGERLEQALSHMKDGDLLIDAIFGTGFHGTPRGTAATAIDYMAAHREDRLVCAIDIPSGLSGDGGEVPEKAVFAHLTISFHARKPVHGEEALGIKPHLGRVLVADIGIGDAIEQGL